MTNRQPAYPPPPGRDAPRRRGRWVTTGASASIRGSPTRYCVNRLSWLWSFGRGRTGGGISRPSVVSQNRSASAQTRRAAALTVRLEEEAYATIVPGVTRDRDLATFLKRRMRELGVEDAWSPAQNPSVNSGPDRGHSHASDRVIQPGDVIQTDFGIKVHGVWVTDIQRFAYVLRPGEMSPPADVQKRWEIARQGSRIALAAMKPGRAVRREQAR